MCFCGAFCYWCEDEQRFTNSRLLLTVCCLVNDENEQHIDNLLDGRVTAAFRDAAQRITGLDSVATVQQPTARDCLRWALALDRYLRPLGAGSCFRLLHTFNASGTPTPYFLPALRSASILDFDRQEFRTDEYNSLVNKFERIWVVSVYGRQGSHKSTIINALCGANVAPQGHRGAEMTRNVQV